MKVAEMEARQMQDSCQTVSVWAEEDILGIHYQAATSEDVEDLVCAAVRSQVCELVIAL
jgi:hypothetical protein